MVKLSLDVIETGIVRHAIMLHNVRFFVYYGKYDVMQPVHRRFSNGR